MLGGTAGCRRVSSGKAGSGDPAQQGQMHQSGWARHFAGLTTENPGSAASTLLMRPDRRISQLHLRLDGNGGAGFISPMDRSFAASSGQTEGAALAV